RRVLAEAPRSAAAGAARRAERGGDVAAQLILRHTFTERRERRLVGGDRDVVGTLHQRELGRGLDHPAAGRHDFCVHVLSRWKLLLDAAGDEETEALLHADTAGGHASISQDARDLLVGALVFLPDADVGLSFDELA